MEEITIPRIDAPIGIERDSDELQDFAKASVEAIEARLRSNRDAAKSHTNVEKSVTDVLANHNTRSLDIRARPLENPKVTLWLKDCPIWANDAWTDTIYPKGINAYNGKVTVTLDVRPF